MTRSAASSRTWYATCTSGEWETHTFHHWHCTCPPWHTPRRRSVTHHSPPPREPRRVNLDATLHDWDPLKRGTVTHSQLVRALASALPAIPVRDLEAVASAFAVDAADGAPLVHYAALLALIDRAFCDPNLHADAATDVDAAFARTVVNAPHPRTLRPTFDAERSAALHEALAFIRVAVNRSRLQCVPRGPVEGVDFALLLPHSHTAPLPACEQPEAVVPRVRLRRPWLHL